MTPLKPQIFERGDRVYMVAPVSPVEPGDQEIAEFAFAQELKQSAPNENIMWLRGQYVEADSANANGQMWTAGELGIKHLTPVLMPVTIMHDVRSAVGLIADARLVLPGGEGEQTASVRRPRIDTTLALWQHRFPEVAEEVMTNYKAGTLMQSMECTAPSYSCGECGRMYQKLPKQEERANWCEHLKESATAVRILENVIFTGTGLIFGGRGARGAYDEAHLEVFQEEVAEFHDKAHRDTRPGKKRKDLNRRITRMETIEIPRSEYDALQQRPTQEALDAEKARATEFEQRAQEAESKVEEAEAAKAKAETEKAAAEEKLSDAEEKAAQSTLREERFEALGDGFKAKLGETTKRRLTEQAGTMSDEDWTARLEELSEAYGVEPTAEAEGGDDDNGDEGKTFTAEEVARSVATAGGNGNEEVSASKRKSVVGGLFERAAK